MSKKPLGPGPGAYQLPTTVGYPSHDPSRYRNPMFSFGTNAAFRLKPLGPGPAYRIDRVTRDGNVNGSAQGPGPGAYQLPTTVGYPSHDPSRYRNPMFSFGTNAAFRLKPLGPGPAYRIDRVTRDGNVSSPAWSFGASFPTRSVLRTPGPGAHAPERCPAMRSTRAPIYSMGARLGFDLKRPGPAANAYALRLGSGTPAYTMGARVGFELKPRSPGPAVYFQQDCNVYRFKMPVYSLGAKLEGAGKPTRTPGPATYPPDLYNVKKNPYSYSFGTRHGDYAPPMIIKEDTMDCL